MREEYFGPVGFAKEPAEERKRWVGRIFTLALIVFLLWMFFTKVVRPPTDNPGLNTPPVQETLPGPK